MSLSRALASGLLPVLLVASLALPARAQRTGGSADTAASTDTVPARTDTTAVSLGDSIGVVAADTVPGDSVGVVATDTIPPVSAGAVAADTIPPNSVGAVAADTIPGDSLGVAVADTVPADSTRAPRPLPPSAEAILSQLRGLPGFTVTEYQGKTAEYSADDGVLRLEGTAQVDREDQQLTADTIVYRGQTDLVEAYGSPKVVGEQQELTGDVLFYDLAARRATALGARTQVVQQATWFVSGDMSVEGTERLFGRNANFTTCDLLIPHYHFESDEVMVIRDNILVARPARLYFGHVPVMILPFVVHNLEQGRRSGLLTPQFGLSDIVRTSSGYTRQISNLGFYWAINDYMGAQIAGTWRSGAYTSLQGIFDYNWTRQFLRGNARFERYWEATGDKQWSLEGQSSWDPDERTSMSVLAAFTTDEQFVRDASYDPREVTRDMRSTFRLSRRFDWGTASLGATRNESIATGDVSMTLPSFSLSLPAMTLFRQPTPELQRWYSNASFTPGPLTFSRSTNAFGDGRELRQNRSQTLIKVGPSFSIGNFSIETDADLNRTALDAAAGSTEAGEDLLLPATTQDAAKWSIAARYQQSLIGTTSISPNITLAQELRRDSVTVGDYLSTPMRLSFGATLKTDLYGFFPGVGSYSAIRHRFSPLLTYRYAPEVEQTAFQERVFGPAGGQVQNQISLSINQTWEAKLRNPTPPPAELPPDTLAGDSIPMPPTPSVPSDPAKVTILSINTTPFVYDFVQRRETGTGFVTDQVSNTISSDYLRGLTIQMRHELFDRTQLDPNEPGNAGKLGRFSPRLSSLSTSFQLGPESSLVRWLDRFRRSLLGDEPEAADADVLPADEPSDSPVPEGEQTATANPQGIGGGPWNINVGYQFTRSPRVFRPAGSTFSDEAVQTLNADVAFQLSPNWSVNWATSYSITDGEFGSHRLNFRRKLHDWQANFSFYQTPNGNSAFEFYVELTGSPQLRFDYGERDLGIDRER